MTRVSRAVGHSCLSGALQPGSDPIDMIDLSHNLVTLLHPG